jgi:HtrA serine peptidase 2
MVCRAAAAIASFAVVTAKSTTSSNPVETEEGSVLKNGANGDLGPALTRYSISSAAEQCAPCVVNIKCGVGGAWGPYAGGGISGISGGSGFILTEDGLVVTNAHVIANCTQGLTVTLPTGEKLSAKVKAMDHQTDLALLQVKADRPLPPAQIGNSGTLKAGEWVIALGSPLFLANSVTAGILSSVARPGSELGEAVLSAILGRP